MANNKDQKPPKQKKSTVKYLTEKEVEDLKKKSTPDLLKDYLNTQKTLRDIRKQKSQDVDLKNTKEQIKKHRDESPSEKTKKELAELKDRQKEIKQEIDSEIPELIDELKEKNADYKDKMGYPNEKAKIVQGIIDSRGGK